MNSSTTSPNPMLTITLSLSIFLHFLLCATATVATFTYTPTNYFLLDCGSSSTTTSADGRKWDGDTHSKFSPSNLTNISSASTASEQAPSVTLVPYMTARIIHSHFTYTFPISAGPKFVRLYFYPATYSGLDKTKSFFSVTAGDYTLLSNFSAFLTSSAMEPPVPSLVKEFIVNVRDNQRLSINFSPSPNSYAFVNGIEVVSIPSDLYIRGDAKRIKFVDQNSPFYLYNTTALETMYRLDVGGNDVPVTGDSGMFRWWRQDDSYIWGKALGFNPHRDIPINYTTDTPNYTAPETVYTTSRTMGNQSLLYNLTWLFPVDAGFYYLLRLHFCEIQLEVTLENQRVFIIYINNQTAEEEADVIAWSGGTGIPVFKDYVVWVADPDDRRSKQDLWLAMYPNLDDGPQYKEAILNGLEIFKLNKSDGSLAGPNPELVVIPPPPAQDSKSPEKRKSKPNSWLIPFAGAVAGGIVAVSILVFLIFRRSKSGKDSETTVAKSSWGPISTTSSSTKASGGSSLPSDLCRHFLLAEVKSATHNFDEKLVIGKGGFGSVYKGKIDNNGREVAIKRLNSSSTQGAREFQTEIEMLSKLRHLHLVSLIGYCDDNGEMILVYDYMARGTLRDHLYKTENPPLPWKQRLQILIGAARGLHYLHAGVKHMIIHRDVKSTNILLDEKWVAKVSDFGLSKLGPMDVSRSHVSTVVKGSFGYVDPEYYRRQQLTEKSDVYSFGVVLCEVLCARPVIIPGVSKEQVNLAGWVRYCFRKRTLDQIIDPNIRGEIAPDCFRKFAEVADCCLRDQGIERPPMSDVVWGLEFALQLQEAAEKMDHVRDAWGNLESPSVPLLVQGEATTTDDEDVFSGSAELVSRSKSSVTVESTVSSDKIRAEAVFSEIKNPTGR